MGKVRRSPSLTTAISKTVRGTVAQWILDEMRKLEERVPDPVVRWELFRQYFSGMLRRTR